MKGPGKGWVALAMLALTTAPSAAEDIEAEIKLFQFKPKVLEVRAGTKVTWSNRDAIEHSVTAGAPGKESGTFDSGYFTQGQVWSYRFDSPGTYAYFCKRHPSMRATITVLP
jgi:plastocyanin